MEYIDFNSTLVVRSWRLGKHKWDFGVDDSTRFVLQPGRNLEIYVSTRSSVANRESPVDMESWMAEIVRT